MNVGVPSLPPLGVTDDLDDDVGVPTLPPPGVTRGNELELWKKWQSSGFKQQHLQPIVDSMQGIIYHTVRKYKGVDIQENMLKAEANKHLVEALRSYNPSSGASLGTHVFNRMKRVDRFVKENQNFGRVVEQRAQKWGDYLGARSLIETELGRPPTPVELAQKMSMRMGRAITPKEAERFMKEDRRDLVQTGLEDNQFTFMPTADRMILKMVPQELTPEENAVFDRVFGMNGSRKMSPGEISRDLRIHPSKVSRIKNTIGSKIEQFYK